MPVSKRGHTYYTKGQYERAKRASALEYARSAGYELKRDGARTFSLKEHDSMVFTEDGRWYWNSRDLRGRALEFIMAYEGKTLPEAVNLLAGEDRREPSPPSEQAAPPKQEPMPFQLPERSDSMKRLFAYLCGGRHIDREIVEFLIRDHRLYEGVLRSAQDGAGKELHNAVFLGLDENGTPRSAFQRGLLSDAPFKRETAGSRKEYAFVLPGRPGTDTVYVFEGAIDAMSHATLFKLLGKDWRSADRIALGGVSTLPLLRYLEHRPDVTEIGLALDGDAAGQNGLQKIKKELEENNCVSKRGCRIFREPEEKDWNDYLSLYLTLSGAKP